MKRYIPLIAVLLLASCATTARRDPFAVERDAPVWPPAPEIARVQYVTSIHRHNDLFETGNVFSSLVRFAVGDEDTRMVRPFALAVHPDGGILVSDMAAAWVHFYDIPRRKYRILGRDLAGGLTSPVGIAVARDGSILVSDSRRRSIERFSRDGRSLGVFGDGYSFQRPGGITVDPVTGDVFAVDVLGHCIAVFSAAGELKRVMGSNGAQSGQFNFPTHIALDTRGEVLVADSMNFRIQRLSSNGQPLAEYGEVGNARGDFARPKGVDCIDEGVYVAVEGLFDSLVFFSADGELLLSLGGAGSEAGQFWLPAGLAMDRQRNLLFVADSYNSRVQVFRMIGADFAADDSPGEKGMEP